MVKIEQLNGVTLAYLGDAVYEVFIREHLLAGGTTKVNELQRLAKHFVSAKAQAALINLMVEENFLTEDEERIYKNGRNAKKNTKAKNTSVVTYHMSTGFESLIGYLDITDDKKRLQEIIDFCIEKVEAGATDAE